MDVSDVAAALRRGEPAILPTDTVYGVGALPEQARIVFELKRRPIEKALPVLGADVVQLAQIAELGDVALHLAERAWPGPLTLVVPRATGFTADLGGTDAGTVAVRVPKHPLTLEVLRRTGPLAVTSANLSGEPPASTCDAARTLWPGVPCLDGGACDGLPSTIVSLAGEPKVLREGALAAAEVLGWVRTARRGS
ncbi:MAG TPA: L-threonylcarbamoyladenylate synthase [Actinomycetota bacterium]|nr:L-threonylcarbamoyladenylate synthase [Actinomycetota bacterium]